MCLTVEQAVAALVSGEPMTCCFAENCIDTLWTMGISVDFYCQDKSYSKLYRHLLALFFRGNVSTYSRLRALWLAIGLGDQFYAFKGAPITFSAKLAKDAINKTIRHNASCQTAFTPAVCKLIRHRLFLKLMPATFVPLLSRCILRYITGVGSDGGACTAPGVPKPSPSVCEAKRPSAVPDLRPYQFRTLIAVYTNMVKLGLTDPTQDVARAGIPHLNWRMHRLFASATLTRSTRVKLSELWNMLSSSGYERWRALKTVASVESCDAPVKDDDDDDLPPLVFESEASSTLFCKAHDIDVHFSPVCTR